jgi:hypothetical protein
MSNLKHFGDPAWDRFFEFISLENDSLSHDEVCATLRGFGVDTTNALRRVRETIDALHARSTLQAARKEREGLLSELENAVSVPAQALRDSIRSIVSKALQGSCQAAYFRKLETSSDDDLLTLLADLRTLESLSKGTSDVDRETK